MFADKMTIAIESMSRYVSPINPGNPGIYTVYTAKYYGGGGGWPLGKK